MFRDARFRSPEKRLKRKDGRTLVLPRLDSKKGTISAEDKAFGTFTNNSNGSCGSAGNGYDAFPYSKISIPAADVNTIISRGDTNVYLSVAPNNDWCTAKSWTLLDENGCTCMSGAMENDGISCTQPADWNETSSCPAGYTKKEGYPRSCYKPNITLREIK